MVTKFAVSLRGLCDALVSEAAMMVCQALIPDHAVYRKFMKCAMIRPVHTVARPAIPVDLNPWTLNEFYDKAKTTPSLYLVILSLLLLLVFLAGVVRRWVTK